MKNRLFGEYWATPFKMAIIFVILAAVLGFIIAVFMIRFGLNKTGLKRQIQPHMLRIVSAAADRHDIMLAP